MATYDLTGLPESKDIVFDDNIYHLVTRPSANLILPATAEWILDAPSSSSTSSVTSGGLPGISPLQLVSTEQAVESMAKLLDMEARNVYSCDGIRNSRIPIDVSICNYCEDEVGTAEFHLCRDCHLLICHDCFTKDIGELFTSEDGFEPSECVSLKESLQRCRTLHTTESKQQKFELIEFNPATHSCDDCGTKFTGEEKKWFNLLGDVDICANCIDGEQNSEIKEDLKEFTPGMTIDDVCHLFDMVQVTSEYKESINNFGSLLNWVPVLIEPSDATQAVYSNVGIEAKNEIDQEMANGEDPDMFVGSIMVNCNPESSRYGRVGISICYKAIEFWFSVGDESLKSVIEDVQDSGGLRRYILRKRLRNTEGAIIVDSLGSVSINSFGDDGDDDAGDDEGDDEGDSESSSSLQLTEL